MLSVNENRDGQRLYEGDYIYYFHRNGDTFPGVILAMPKAGSDRIKITYDSLEGEVTAYVMGRNLDLQ